MPGADILYCGTGGFDQIVDAGIDDTISA